MSKLWVFGDSCSSSLTELRNNPLIEDFVQRYNGGNDYEIWYEIAARKLGMECESFGKSGSCNYAILERICANWDVINENDIVVINWSVLERFRVAFGPSNRDYITILATYMSETHGKWIYDSTKKHLKNSDVSIESAIEVGYNRYKFEHLFQNEVNSWSYMVYNFFKQRNVNVIFWGLTKMQDYYFMQVYDAIIEKKGLIHQETNDDILDWHFGLTGNDIFADYIIEKIKSNDFEIPKERFFIPPPPHPIKKPLI